MSKLLECTGTLLRFDVPRDGDVPASAILLCSDCGALFVGPPDERHVESAVLDGD
jgi:hypothetical protein